MSDAETSAPPATPAKPLFTEKEERVLKVAWSCLKSGPPDVDIEKLQKAAGFNTTKTASNTWAVIKKKLATLTEDGASPSTPKKTPTSTKKRGKKVSAATVDEADDDDEATPAKKQKTSPAPATDRPKRGRKLTAKAKEAAEAAKIEESEGEEIVVKPRQKAVKGEEAEEDGGEEAEVKVQQREHGGEGSEDGEIIDCEG